jgi:diadenosine tetraphosphatase ApaH/serine/threonine PP2A family protein phosphatase
VQRPPRRVAVVSDVHGNLAALEAVRAAVAGDAADEVWCLGDVIGYGPRPNECCGIIESWASVALAGNHDLGGLGLLPLSQFSPVAATALEWTQRQLSRKARGFLASLAPSSRLDGLGLFHGSPRDPVWEYVLSGEAVGAAFAVTDARLVLVGHSHVALAISRSGSQLEGGLAPGGTEVGLADARWLLNPGSIGQPRDGDPRAAYLLLDLERGRAEFRRVEYEIDRTQSEMRELGLPDQLASRLRHGA